MPLHLQKHCHINRIHSQNFLPPFWTASEALELKIVLFFSIRKFRMEIPKNMCSICTFLALPSRSLTSLSWPSALRFKILEENFDGMYAINVMNRYIRGPLYCQLPRGKSYMLSNYSRTPLIRPPTSQTGSDHITVLFRLSGRCGHAVFVDRCR